MLDPLSGVVVEYTADGMVIRCAAARYVTWAILFAMIAIPALVCWRKRVAEPFAKIAGLISLAIPLLVLPGLATDRVEIRATTMVMRTGVWFAPTHHTIAVEGLLAITARKEIAYELIPRTRSSERKPHEINVWVFHYPGFTRSVPLSDLLYAHRARVLQFFRQRGVEVSGA